MPRESMIRKNPIPSIALYAFLALFLCFPPSAAGAQDADFVIEGLQKRYDSTDDYVADFRQETELKTLDRSLKFWGKVFFQRPGKMLWRYEEPKDQVILADGEHLFFYQPKEKQIIKSPLSNTFRSDVPLSFLLGMGNLKRDFKATLMGSAKELFTLQLVPRRDSGGFGEISMGVEKGTFDLLWARFHDLGGNVITIYLDGMRRGIGLKDSVFQLEVPGGVDIVEFDN